MDFAIRNHKVWLDGREFVLLSGAIHYFRTLPEQWRDRMQMLKSCGFNTVETYAAWHLHEKQEGEFDFSQRLDLAAFIRLAGEMGLMVILRPGPYICSECDLGGMPGWLLGKSGIRLRCSNPVFMDYACRYLREVMAQVRPLLCTNGGPVIAIQVENEYGSYGRDKKYLQAIADCIRENGGDVQLFTSDGATEVMLANGTLPDIPATVNYRNRPRANLAALASIDTGYANAPVTMELWNGKAWHWGKMPFHHEDEDVAQDYREILEDGSSVNSYMFHGGTNFGFTSGANFFNGQYCPLLTSYEVDSLLDEGGNPTAKYFAVQKVMEELRPGSTAPVSRMPAKAYPEIRCTGFVPLADVLDRVSTPVELPLPENMEYFGQSTGFIHYKTVIQPYHSGNYMFRNMRDRAIVFLNGNPVAAVYRNDAHRKVWLNVTEKDSVLEILVENMGRINFGTEMENETRGMTGFYLENGTRQLGDWVVRPMPLEDAWEEFPFKPFEDFAAVPGFYRAELEIAEDPQDTWLEFPAGVRGYVQVNGFNIGRYWQIGPQRTLYIPRPLLHRGKNVITVFELHGLHSAVLRFRDRRGLDPLAPMPAE